MKYLLDTNVCIRYLTGRSDNIKKQFRREEGDFFLCAPVKAELLAGAYKSTRIEENLQSFATFFGPLASLDFDDAAAAHYAEIRSQLEQAGTPIGPMDLLIASIGRANALILVTHNTREFGRVADLDLEDWE